MTAEKEGADGVLRCAWVGDDPLYIAYHDAEWGVPIFDGRSLWEMLILEGFQAGLSWITILRKREGFRRAFHGFDPKVISNWGEDDVTRLLQDANIVRHRGKIEGTIKSAQAYLELEANQGFSQFIWSYVDGKPIVRNPKSLKDVPAKTETSEKMSKDLKKLGFKFCGPTIVYAFMQAAGLVNDHTRGCHCRSNVKSETNVQ